MVDQKADALREAIELFYFAYRAFTARADQLLSQRGLNRAHHRILYFVARTPGLSVNGLLTVLDISKQALNLPLRQLVDMQLVTMESASHDRRCKALRLTGEGLALEQQLTETQLRLLAKVFADEENAATAWSGIMRRFPEAAQGF